MNLTIIIVSFNTKDLLKDCLRRVCETQGTFTKEIIIIDNNSTDGSPRMLKTIFPEVKLIENSTNQGFARAVSQGMSAAKGDFILLLNPDAFIENDTIAKTLDFMKTYSKCGILGCGLIDESGAFQPSARLFPTPWRLFCISTGLSEKFRVFKGVDDDQWHIKNMVECDWVPGCYFLIRRKVVDEIGIFDRDYFLYYEEIDYCLRTKKAGWKVICYSDVKVTHIGGESSKQVNQITEHSRQLEDLKLQSEYIYFRKNYGLLFVLLDFFLILLSHCIGILKGIILFKKKDEIGKRMKRMKLAINILISTKLGAESRN